MDKDKLDLDGFFDAARTAQPEPSSDLMARITAQALAEQPLPHLARPPAPAPWWRQALQALGGWPGAAGLLAACAAGVWIGITPPAALDTILGLDSATLGEIGLDPMTSFDLTLLEG